MLKSIDPLLTPALLHSLAAMGHGDRLAVVDRNYPAEARHERVHQLPGADVVEATRAICTLLPLDDFVQPAAFRMVPDGEPGAGLAVHVDVARELSLAHGRPVTVAPVERMAFYDLAASVYAVVQTTEDRPYGCFVLTKGVV